MSATIDSGILNNLRLHPAVHEVRCNLGSLAVHDMFLTGSTAFNGHGNDVDIVVVTASLDEAAAELNLLGWGLDTAETYLVIKNDGWFSAKMGRVNLLVSTPDVAALWATGACVCMVFRELVGRDTTKVERVALHRAVWGEL